MTAGHVNPEVLLWLRSFALCSAGLIGDMIHVRVTIQGKREAKRPDSGIVVELCEVLNQSAEVVLACEHLQWCVAGKSVHNGSCSPADPEE